MGSGIPVHLDPYRYTVLRQPVSVHSVLPPRTASPTDEVNSAELLPLCQVVLVCPVLSVAQFTQTTTKSVSISCRSQRRVYFLKMQTNIPHPSPYSVNGFRQMKTRGGYPGVIGSVLGPVGPVSVYCDWVRWIVWYAASISVRQHVKLSEQIRP